MDPDFIGEATVALEDVYSSEDFTIEYRPSFDDKLNRFTLECFSKDYLQMHTIHEKLFWDVPSFFNLSPEHLYCLRITTYKDIGVPVEKAVFTLILETKTGCMPNLTKEITKESWERFTNQLKYTVNGEPAEMEIPANVTII